MRIVKSIIRIVLLSSLIILGYTVGEYQGYNIGVSSMGEVAGPALYRCVDLLGGKLGRIER